MKKIFNWVFTLSVAVALTACLGDNYQQPDSGFHGGVFDAETGDLIQQDIGGEGSQIEVLEWTKDSEGNLIYPKPDTRRLNFMTDGNFRDNNFFKGDYRIQFNLTNFNNSTVVLESKDSDIKEETITEDITNEETGEVTQKTTTFKVIHLKGDTEMNIKALPWCRVTVKEIRFDDEKQRVFAQFEVESTSNNPVEEVGLFCDQSKHVSYSINNWGDNSSKKVKVGRVLTEPTTFTVKMPLTMFQDKDSDKDYWIRVGAHTKVEGSSDVRWNYAPAQMIHIVMKPVETKPMGIRWDLFDKKYEEMWQNGKHKSLDQLYFDDKDFKSGDGCYVAVSGPVTEDAGYRFTTYISPGEGKGGIKPVFDISSIPEEGCHMQLTMYISDATKLKFDEQSQIEIGSNAVFDDEEICWIFGAFANQVKNGWQTLDLSLPEASGKIGTFRPKRVNWFRLYHKDFEGNVTLKFDEIRFYYKTMIESCDFVDGWAGTAAVTLDESDCQEGEGAVSTTNNADGIRLQKTWGKEYLPTTRAGGHFQFWLFVSDASAFNGVDNQVEIGSGGRADVNELHWALPTLTDGWNKIDLKLEDAIEVGGDFDVRSMNWFRVYSNCKLAAGSVTMKVDRLRFYKEGFKSGIADFED
ncbi:MAG: DUF3823 domain-containing protein [Bacteroidales bacterium]|nr:DUF3823 domain-containing protein [Bacteroidales bacterium]